jgi:hypothetical protein
MDLLAAAKETMERINLLVEGIDPLEPNEYETGPDELTHKNILSLLAE